MRFMLLMMPKGYETAQPGAMPDASAVAAMMKYNEALQKRACCSRWMGFIRPRWARAFRFREGSPR